VDGANLAGSRLDGVKRPCGAGFGTAKEHLGRTPMPPPSRHIYKPLTITVAFHGLLAFDRAWQHPIKVDGTFV
jgi:hypothetical protein